MFKSVIKFQNSNKLKQKKFERQKALEKNNETLNTKEAYIMQVDNMKVEMIYSNTNKSFRDCIINILQQKYKKAD